MATGAPVKIIAPGFGQFRRDLAKISAGLRKAADAHIRKLAAEVRAEARRRAPRRTGRLQRSYRYSVRAKGASVYSDLEYAPVHEFGGKISPRGTAIQIEKSAPIYGAIAAKADDIEEQLGGLLDAIANTSGFSSTSIGGGVGTSPLRL